LRRAASSKSTSLPRKFSSNSSNIARKSKIRFAVARLESVCAGEAFERLGITDALHRDHFFHSVDEAIRVLAKNTNEFLEDRE